MSVCTFLQRATCAFCFVLALGCRAPQDAPPTHADRGHAEPEHAPGEHEEGVLHVDQQERTKLGLNVVAAGPGTIDQGIELLGEVHPNGDRLAHITPRFPGIVREVRRSVGEIVKAGDVLAILESSESLAPYELKTLIDGTIIEKHLTRGEAIDRETQAFVIADLSTVWVDLSVYQRELERIRLGQVVRVRASDDRHPADGTIAYLTPGLDQITRTARARVVLPNPEGHWRTGMFVTALAVEPASAAVAVPASAIQTVQGQPSVFTVSGDEIRARTISLGRQGDTTSEVLSGLNAGEQVIATNSFLLKAELGKGEAEHED